MRAITAGGDKVRYEDLFIGDIFVDSDGDYCMVTSRSKGFSDYEPLPAVVIASQSSYCGVHTYLDKDELVTKIYRITFEHGVR
jgi:hypothetical protein